MVRRGIALGVVVVVLAGLAWWMAAGWRAGQAMTVSGAGVEALGAPSEVGSPALEEVDPAGETLAVPGDVGSRLAVEGPLLVGTVTGDGQPLDGAQVSWTAVTPGFDEEQFWWRPESRSLVADSSVSTLSGEGRFAFSEMPTGLRRESVVWVTCPGYLGASIDRDDERGDLTLELARAAPMRVLVVDGDDRPVNEAAVVLRGMADDVSSLGRSPEALRRSRSRRALLRTFATDDEGAVLVPSVPGRVMVTAEAGAARSAPYIGEVAPEVVLRIGSTFSAGGQVSVLGGTDVLASDVWVECAGSRGFQLEHVARVALRADHSWAMESVPWRRWDQLVFRLHGGLLSNREVAVVPPEPGEHVRLDFEDIGPGAVFRVRVVDTSGAPIAGASAYASAQLPGGEWHGRSARTDENGLATISGSGPGQVWVQVESDGFVGGTDGPFEVEPGREYGAVVVTLTAAASVTGRCTFEGEPVESFDLLYWTETPQDHEIQPFRDRVDGRFELDKAPAGRLFLRAQSPGLGSSESIFVEVAPGTPNEVEIELRPPASARGRVVAADTGEGLAGATLAVFDRERRRTLTQLGPTVETALDGSFELHSLNPGENGVLVQAAGRAKRFLLVHGDPDAPAQLGAVGLEREGLLRVRLAASPPIDFSMFAFSAVGDETSLDRRPFPANGLLEFTDIAPGTWRLVVHTPAGGWIHRSGSLSPGRAWEVTFDVSPTRRLHVVVEPDAQGRVPEGLVVVTAYRDADHSNRTAAMPLSEDGRVTFESLPRQDLFVSLRDAAGRTLDTREVRWEEAREQTVRLDPRAEPTRVRVVDASGAPIAGVQVVAMAAGAANRWSGAGDTDRDGWVELGAGELRDLVVVLTHPSRGTRLGVPLDLESDRELTLDVQEGLHVRLLDGAVPCASVDVDVWDAASSFWVGRFATDGDGGLRIDDLQGEVALDVQASGLWSTRAVVATRASGEPQTVQVPRTGAVEVIARTAGGLPVASAQVELHSTDLDQSAAGWLADGRLSLPAGLRTDSDGRLVVAGIPRGTYAWRVLGLEGGTAAGTVEVVPLGSVLVEALLDP